MPAPFANLPTGPDRKAISTIIEIFGQVFVDGEVVSEKEESRAVQVSRDYFLYVQRLAHSLQAQLATLVAQNANEPTLAQAAEQLARLELSRRGELAPFLGMEAGTVASASVGLEQLRQQLRNIMATELETIRDSRLRIEFRRTELINHRVGISTRIIVRGAAQVRLHFGNLTVHAATKT